MLETTDLIYYPDLSSDPDLYMLETTDLIDHPDISNGHY